MQYVATDSINFVVGFDLGHGETSLMGVNLKSEHKKETAFEIEVNGKSNFITAIAYHPEHGVLIGEPAITTDGVTESHLAFKRRPNDDATYQKIMIDYVRYIHQHLKNSRHGFTDENTFSSLIESRKRLSPIASSTDTRVLALYDLTFMTEPYNGILDNNQLIANIADWLIPTAKGVASK